jgi:hypothetical protein
MRVIFLSLWSDTDSGWRERRSKAGQAPLHSLRENKLASPSASVRLYGEFGAFGTVLAAPPPDWWSRVLPNTLLNKYRICIMKLGKYPVIPCYKCSYATILKFKYSGV